MTFAKRRFCMFCAVLLVLTVTASAFFMAYGVLHDCSGEGCAVCRDLAFLRNAAGSFGALAVQTGICTLLGVFFPTARRPVACMRAGGTPITKRDELTC